jgi:colanic acid biosynthesis glycosyl transferase WcaI
LVVNQKGIKGVSVPSKLYGVMAVGKPVLGVLEEGSEARMIIEESGCGFCVNPQDYNAIVNSIWKFYKRDKGELMNIGLRGREYLCEHLTKIKSINKYKQLFNKL